MMGIYARFAREESKNLVITSSGKFVREFGMVKCVLTVNIFKFLIKDDKLFA